MKQINLGNTVFRINTVGVDETLEKLNLLQEKLKEAKSLIHDIASMEIDIKFATFEQQEDEEEGI